MNIDTVGEFLRVPKLASFRRVRDWLTALFLLLSQPQMNSPTVSASNTKFHSASECVAVSRLKYPPDMGLKGHVRIQSNGRFTNT